jgi:hypothetical protein
MEEDLAQIKHRKNINLHKLNIKENADIYYNNKAELLRNTGSLNFSPSNVVTSPEGVKNDRSPDTASSKPPKYPSPSNYKNEEDKYEEMGREFDFQEYIEQVEGTEQMPGVKNKHLNEKFLNANFMNNNIGREELRSDIKSGSSTLKRAEPEENDSESDQDQQEVQLQEEEVQSIRRDIMMKFLKIKQDVPPGHEKFLETIDKFKRDRSLSPANQEALYKMKAKVGVVDMQTSISKDSQMIKVNKKGAIKGALPPKRDNRFGKNIKEIYEIQEKSVEQLSKEGKMSKDFFKDVFNYISERNNSLTKNDDEQAQDGLIIKDKKPQGIGADMNNDMIEEESFEGSNQEEENVNNDLSFQDLLQKNVDVSREQKEEIEKQPNELNKCRNIVSKL